MNVQQLLDAKPKNFVETVGETQTLADVVKRLAELKIGAIVVSDGSGGVAGIISERDIVRQLAAIGPSCLTSAVKDAMVGGVHSLSLQARAHWFSAGPMYPLSHTQTPSSEPHVPCPLHVVAATQSVSDGRRCTEMHG